MSELWRHLGLRPGVICLTGSGGKTTMGHLLARTLPGTVIFCTTTRIYPSETLPVYTGASEEELAALLAAHRSVCAGTIAAEGKLAAPGIDFPRLEALADYVVVEADGSRRLPLKAHLPHEPVLPAGFARNLLLVGATGFGRPIREAAHRAERFAALSGCPMDAPATVEAVAAVLRKEGGFDTVIVNQASGAKPAKALAALLDVPVWYGELQKETLTRC